ncbi:MAG: TMEM43 family protein [Cyanobacteria bacterium SZAS TMP-1]|nr:TMEM43 family protein [Cyanobacteria bacterium SZAS TMP-1]
MYVERTRQSLGDNIAGSFFAAFFGFVFFVGAIYLEVWNEGRAVKDHQSLQAAARDIISVSPTALNPANEGKLLYMTGMVVTKQDLEDHDFDIKLRALRMIRKSAMYQWTEDSNSDTEKKAGGGSETVTTYTYSKQWDEDLIKSASFKRRSGHENPDSFKFPPHQYTAGDATIGAYCLSAKLLEEVPAVTAYVPPRDKDTANLPASAFYKIRVCDNGFYIGKDPALPAVGDEKVFFSYVPANRQYSLIAIQSQRTLTPFKGGGGTTFDLMEEGLVSSDKLLQGAESQSQVMTWALRVLGIFIMFIGLLLMAAPLSAVLSIIPFVGDIAGIGVFFLALGLSWSVSLIVVGFAWMLARPLLGYSLLGAAVLFLLLTFGRRAPGRK